MKKCKSSENAYGKTKGIQRAHIESRIETARQLFECEPKKSIEDFFCIFMANDKAVLVNATERENKTKGELPEIIPFCLLSHSKKAYFKCLHIGYEHKKREAIFLKKLHSTFKENGCTGLKPAKQL